MNIKNCVSQILVNKAGITICWVGEIAMTFLCICMRPQHKHTHTETTHICTKRNNKPISYSPLGGDNALKKNIRKTDLPAICRYTINGRKFK